MTNCETGLHQRHIADGHKTFTASWEYHWVMTRRLLWVRYQAIIPEHDPAPPPQD